MGNVLSANTKEILISDDRKISFALMASFVVLTIQYLVLSSFDLLDTRLGSNIQLFSKALVGITFVIALPVVLRKAWFKCIAIYFIAIFIFLINYFLYPENQVQIREVIFPFFFICLPAFIFAMTLDDWRVFKQTMNKAGMIVLLCGSALGLLIFAGKVSLGSYSMSLSYYMLLPAIIYLDELINKFSIRTFLYTSVSVLIILALGSRGAILCILVFVCLKLFRYKFKQNHTRLLFSLCTLFVLVIIFFYRNLILNFIYHILLEFGIKSRSIMLLMREDVHLSGREDIYKNVIEEIKNNPFFGIGIAGDRSVTGSGYVHNIFIEILANFGIVLGSILSVILISFVCSRLFVKDREIYSMYVIWICIGFVHLMISSSYIIDYKFWILLGLLINGILLGRNRMYVD